jgi:hypothetical protein
MCTTVKRVEKRAKSLYFEVEVFGAKLGYLGSGFWIFMRVAIGNGTKNGWIDCFPCYDKR